MARILIPFLALGLALPALAGEAAGGEGARLYATHCVACHQVEAVGAPGIAPPLAGTLAKRAASEEGRQYLVKVPSTGMVGAITVEGVRYNGNMPAFPSLSDGEIAAVLGHLLRDHNGVTDLAWLTPEFVAAVRQAGGTSNDTHKLRGRVMAATGG